jgi:hypothetical protein
MRMHSYEDCNKIASRFLEHSGINEICDRCSTCCNKKRGIKVRRIIGDFFSPNDSLLSKTWLCPDLVDYLFLISYAFTVTLKNKFKSNIHTLGSIHEHLFSEFQYHGLSDSVTKNFLSSFSSRYSYLGDKELIKISKVLLNPVNLKRLRVELAKLEEI